MRCSIVWFLARVCLLAGVTAVVHLPNDAAGQPSPPRIIRQPESILANTGDTVSFEVGVEGALRYYWYHDGSFFRITGPRLTISVIGLADAGSYSVLASNATGVAWSETALLSVAGRSQERWERRRTGSGSRRGHTAVWTGEEAIVWGGTDDRATLLRTGGRYRPKTDRWESTDESGAPSGRWMQGAVWSGSEMLLWGGRTSSGFEGSLNDGFRYDPRSDSWRRMTLLGSPAPRSQFFTVWTGQEMLVWGGVGSVYHRDGGRYDPALDRWRPISSAGAPSARLGQVAVWTGEEMIVWGGLTQQGGAFVHLNGGGRYNPTTDTWRPLSLVGQPQASALSLGAWTGNQMIVWGIGPGAAGRYDPLTDTWAPISLLNAPNTAYVAAWSGTELVVMGGAGGIADQGARYNPVTDLWTLSRASGSPPATDPYRTDTGLWVGDALFYYGVGTALYFPGGRVDPEPRIIQTPESESRFYGDRITLEAAASGAEPLAVRWFHDDELVQEGGATFTIVDAASADSGTYWITASNVLGAARSVSATVSLARPAGDRWEKGSVGPIGRAGFVNVWTGQEMIIWGGTTIGYFLNDGGRYNPVTDHWTISSIDSRTPGGRWLHGAAWTGTEMITWGGRTTEAFAGARNDGGRYDPGLNRWQPPPTTFIAPPARSQFSTVWTGEEMIIWGGSSDSEAFSSGRRYDPALNEWRATSLAGVPGPRLGHVAVWTGEEMIVWGGLDRLVNTFFPASAGGRYNPETDTWTAVSTSGQPEATTSSVAVWTGTEMIVWGGSRSPGDQFSNRGARYNPRTDRWSPLSTANGPEARRGHIGVWTGSEMIVWGGVNSTGLLRTGGRYDPATDSWTSMTLAGGAPGMHFDQPDMGIWTGREMLVFGGRAPGDFSDTYRYVPPGLNAPPRFQPGPNQVVAEDAGPQTVPGWATGIDPGSSADEGQTWTFLVETDNPQLFAAGPLISSEGNLTYVPAPDAHGTAVITIVLKDDGGTAHGSMDSTEPVTREITVLPVNDCPAATPGVLVLEEDTTATVRLLAEDAEGDPVTFHIVVPPAHGRLSGVTPSLIYQPDPDYCGSDRFIFAASDGSNECQEQAEISITVACVNDCPQAVAVVIPPIWGVEGTNWIVLSSNNRTALVLFDGSLSNDPEGDALSFRWFETASPLVAETLPEGTGDSNASGKTRSEAKSNPPGKPAGKSKSGAGDGCDGKVYDLHLRYTGTTATEVMIVQEDGAVVFTGLVLPDQTFGFQAEQRKGFGKNIFVWTNNTFVTGFRTDCSDLIGPGTRAADFLVVGGTTTKGEALPQVGPVPVLSPVEFSTLVVAGRELFLGRHNILLQVSDGRCVADTTLQVHVIAATDSVSVCEWLVKLEALRPAQERSLLRRLEQARTEFGQDKTEKGVKSLLKFRKSVEGWTKRGELDEESADRLTDCVDRIIEAFEGG